MTLPDEVIECVNKIVTENRTKNIMDVISECVCAVRCLDCFEEVQDNLVNNAIQDLVYDARHRINVKLKKESGGYLSSATDKTKTGRAAVEKVAATIFDYCIAGTTLGELTGDMLFEVEKKERAIAAGHNFNANLCKRLQVFNLGEKKVKELPIAKVKKIFDTLKAGC